MANTGWVRVSSWWWPKVGCGTAKLHIKKLCENSFFVQIWWMKHFWFKIISMNHEILRDEKFPEIFGFVQGSAVNPDFFSLSKS